MRRGRLLVIELLLLLALFILDFYDDGLFFVVISIALLLAPPINATVAGILIWSARQAPDIESLQNRAEDAVTLFLASLGGAVAAIVTLARSLGLDSSGLGHPALIFLGFAMLLLSVPAVGWLTTWRRLWLPAIVIRRDRAARDKREAD